LTPEQDERVFTPTEKDSAAAALPSHAEFGQPLLVMKGKKVVNIFGAAFIVGFIALLLHSSITGKLVTAEGAPSPINNPLILAAISLTLIAISLYRLQNCFCSVIFYARHMEVMSLRSARVYAYKDIRSIKHIENRRKNSLLTMSLFSNRMTWVYQILLTSGDALIFDSVKYSFLPIKMTQWTTNLSGPGPKENSSGETEAAGATLPA
jgi:hypothetical protein